MRTTLPKLLLVTLVWFQTSAIFAQEEIEEVPLWENKSILSTSFQHQELPGNWYINYYGVSAEFHFSEMVSISGPIFFGWDRGDNFYLHLPVAGLVVWASVAWLFSEDEDDDEDLDWVSPGLAKTLITENIHFNFRVGDKMTLSPFITLLGADLTGNDEQGTGNSLLSTGAGFKIKALLSKNIVLSSAVSFRYYIIGDPELFGSGNQFGTTMGFNLGFVL